MVWEFPRLAVRIMPRPKGSPIEGGALFTTGLFSLCDVAIMPTLEPRWLERGEAAGARGSGVGKAGSATLGAVLAVWMFLTKLIF